ncbi:MAG TPA: hypothetical protein VFK59_05075 [Actinomycetota bacterium]|jgi:hypothetical protein|nr:hypothetical protein [Actinomycetota bacterium]
MSRRTIQVSFAIALMNVMTLGLVGPAAGDVTLGRRSYPADLSIEYDQAHDRFEGNLDTASFCQGARLVSVYEVRPGSDRLVGRDKTNRRGIYEVENANGRTGNFYARTLVSLRGEGERLCKGDKSDTIQVTEP